MSSENVLKRTHSSTDIVSLAEMLSATSEGPSVKQEATPASYPMLVLEAPSCSDVKLESSQSSTSASPAGEPHAHNASCEKMKKRKQHESTRRHCPKRLCRDFIPIESVDGDRDNGTVPDLLNAGDAKRLLPHFVFVLRNKHETGVTALYRSAALNNVRCCCVGESSAGSTWSYTIFLNGAVLAKESGTTSGEARLNAIASAVAHLRTLVPTLHVRTEKEFAGTIATRATLTRDEKPKPQAVADGSECTFTFRLNVSNMLREFAGNMQLDGLVFPWGFSRAETRFIILRAQELGLECVFTRDKEQHYFSVEHKMSPQRIVDKVLRDGPTARYRIEIPLGSRKVPESSFHSFSFKFMHSAPRMADTENAARNVRE